jgi:hypothetical protein
MNIAELKSTDLFSVVIALLGVTVSLIGTLYLTNRKINAELRLRRIELTKAYAENLLKKRLECYPELYCMIGDYFKIADELSYSISVPGVSEVNRLKTLYENINSWDSKNALLISNACAQSMYHARTKIRSVFDRYQGLEAQAIGREERKNINDVLERVEIALKTDIGVYEIGEFESRPPIDAYSDLSRRYGSR